MSAPPTSIGRQVPSPAGQADPSTRSAGPPPACRSGRWRASSGQALLGVTGRQAETAIEWRVPSTSSGLASGARRRAGRRNSVWVVEIAFGWFFSWGHLRKVCGCPAVGGINSAPLPSCRTDRQCSFPGGDASGAACPRGRSPRVRGVLFVALEGATHKAREAAGLRRVHPAAEAAGLNWKQDDSSAHRRAPPPAPLPPLPAPEPLPAPPESWLEAVSLTR